MSRLPLFFLLVSLSLFQVICADNSSSTGSTGSTYVTDTLGKVFSVSCSTSLCTLTPMDSTLKALSCENLSGGTDTFALLFGTQILTVQALMVPSSGNISLSAAEPAHPVACATDADCLPDWFSPAYTCQNGLCQSINTSTPMLTVDVIVLCQADIRWPLSCPYVTDPVFVGRLAEIAALCGSTSDCTKIPPDCRQPTAVTPGPDASASPDTPSIDAGAGEMDGGS